MKKIRQSANTFDQKRKMLVEDYIRPLRIEGKILNIFGKVPRHEFIPHEYRDSAYENNALPVGEGQTISQPSLVAIMTQALGLKGHEKILEIGTGSGYQAAILSYLAKEVYTIERIKLLAQKSIEILEKLQIKNVYVFEGDGSLGLPKYAPYDAIIVTAGAREIPNSLVDQLKTSGRIVIPVGESKIDQKLIVGRKNKGRLETEEVEPVRFVPLIGKYGWED